MTMKAKHILIFAFIFSLNLSGQNNPPQFTSVPDTLIFEGQPYIYQITATDADGDSIVFLETDLPEWLSIYNQYAKKDTAYLIGSPTEFFDTAKVVIGITDEIDTTYQLFNIFLICSSCGISINTQPIDTAYINSYYEYNIWASFSDPGMEILFESNNLPSWLSLENIGSGTAVLSGTPSACDKGTCEITIRAYMTDDPCFNDTWQVFDLKIVDQITSIKNRNTQGIEIYPVPCSNRLFIEPRNIPVDNYKLRIYNATGDNIQIINWIGQNHELDISSLSKGIYLLKMSDENDYVVSLVTFIKL